MKNNLKRNKPILCTNMAFRLINKVKRNNGTQHSQLEKKIKNHLRLTHKIFTNRAITVYKTH